MPSRKKTSARKASPRGTAPPPTPRALKQAAGRTLAEARRAMATPEYLFALDRLPPAERAAGYAKLSEVHLAYLRWRAARLDEIRARLEAQAPALQAGIEALQGALARLERVRPILKAVDRVLALVARILDLAK